MTETVDFGRVRDCYGRQTYIGRVEVAFTCESSRLGKKWRGEAMVRGRRVFTGWLYTRAEVLDKIKERIADAWTAGEIVEVEL